MKIAIVNDIHVGKAFEHNGRVRASSQLVEGVLKRYLNDIIRKHSPHVLVNLGDLIRSEEKELDLTTYCHLLKSFQQIECPVIHLVGNHELKKIPLDEIESAWHKSGFNQHSYGVKNIEGLSLIWLGLEADPKNDKIRSIPAQQLDWLRNQLKQTAFPTLIFTHCCVDDHNVDGNFFYEELDKEKISLFIKNQEAVQQVISESNGVVAVLQAHLHYFHAKHIGKIPYITCPAMGDHIYGSGIPESIPEIYTILTFKNNRLTAKAFSGDYCFAGYESNGNLGAN